MKNKLQLLVFTLLLINVSCCAQQLVKSKKDVKKLEENKNQFIGKPLKDLLKEIKPKIESASFNNTHIPGYFVFRFISNSERQKSESKNKSPLSIRVFVKEPFEWEFKTRPKGKELEWTIEDAEKYGNLTITAIYVTGQVLK